MADKRGGFCRAGFEQSLRIRIAFVASFGGALNQMFSLF